MTVRTNIIAEANAELAGDLHPLIEQLGSAEGLALSTPVAGHLHFGRVADLPALRSFLERYRTQVLVPVELPLIVAAFGHASRNELRELLALDARIAAGQVLGDFARASCRVGQRQLNRLRALRDQRIVQRYRAAIDAGEARGWHTLVYGISLAVFSLPVRQGLQNYAQHTIEGFVDASAKPLRLAEADCQALLTEQNQHVPRAIELAIAAQSALSIG